METSIVSAIPSANISFISLLLSLLKALMMSNVNNDNTSPSPWLRGNLLAQTCTSGLVTSKSVGFGV